MVFGSRSTEKESERSRLMEADFETMGARRLFRVFDFLPGSEPGMDDSSPGLDHLSRDKLLGVRRDHGIGGKPLSPLCTEAGSGL